MLLSLRDQGASEAGTASEYWSFEDEDEKVPLQLFNVG